MQTAIHLTELYAAVLSDETDHDCVALDFRTPEMEFTIEFAARSNGRFFNVCKYDETGTGVAITERLKVLASNRSFMLTDDGPSFVVLQTAESAPDQLVDQTEAIIEALDAHRFACVAVEEKTVEGDILSELQDRLRPLFSV